MKPNPGGHIAPEEIIGRDGLILEMWEILEGRSIYMNDLRRIGKTKILLKMEDDPPAGWNVVFHDLENFKSAAELSTWFYRSSLQKFTHKKAAFRRMGDLLGNLKGGEIAGVLKIPNGGSSQIAPWKETMSRTFDDLEEGLKEENEKLVFCLDEVPYMIEGILKNEGADIAMEVLDTFRKLAQSYESIRFVLTGSIGIHHVLALLQKEGYNGSPLNNFQRVSPGPLGESDATHLAEELIQGRGLKVEELSASARHVAQITGGVAFYIHRLVDRAQRDTTYNSKAFEQLLVNEISDSEEDWDLMHYLRRIGISYYLGEGEKELSLASLDSIAASKNGLNYDELLNQVKLKTEEVEDESLRSILKLLVKDHYLVKSTEGNYSFRMALVRRWWKMEREL